MYQDAGEVHYFVLEPGDFRAQALALGRAGWFPLTILVPIVCVLPGARPWVLCIPMETGSQIQPA